MEENNTTNNVKEVVSYEKDKIQLLFNILNSVQFTGIQQAQAIAQISVILGKPLKEPLTDENEDLESGD